MKREGKKAYTCSVSDIFYSCRFLTEDIFKNHLNIFYYRDYSNLPKFWRKHEN